MLDSVRIWFEHYAGCIWLTGWLTNYEKSFFTQAVDCCTCLPEKGAWKQLRLQRDAREASKSEHVRREAALRVASERRLPAAPAPPAPVPMASSGAAASGGGWLESAPGMPPPASDMFSSSMTCSLRSAIKSGLKSSELSSLIVKSMSADTSAL